MAGTYSEILLHVVFSTKNRANLIKPEIQLRLYEYMGGIIRAEKGTTYAIGGTPDHVHLLIRWRTDETVATLLRNLKSNSSRWIKDTFPAFGDFAWQEGYGVFSVSHSQVETVKHYIENQEEHHRGRSFKEEFIRLLEVHDIEYDERYIWE
ncbi:MAG TPA: IS200/IS605 family transposase [Phycisphaerae bacterium]|nr:IS200/IS605 family transposase [Phycisphaerae bacterium]